MNNDTPTQQEEVEDTVESPTTPTTFLTRRRMIKGTAGIGGLAAFGGLGLWYGTQPALAADTFTEDGGQIVVNTNTGEVEDVTVKPLFDLTWADFGNGVDDFSFSIDAAVGEDTATVYEETSIVDGATSLESVTGDFTTYDGSATVSCNSVSLLTGGITAGSFPTGVMDGSSASQGVTLTLNASGTTNLGGNAVAQEVGFSFDVLVENPEGTSSASFTEVEVDATATDSDTDETSP